MDKEMNSAKARILHTMLRVGDMRRSVSFYTGALGMRVLREFNDPTERFSLAFLGYGKEKESAVLELTYNYGVNGYNKGDAFGHIAIGVSSIADTCDAVKASGGEIILEPILMTGLNEVIAFIRDPDGYQVELVERSRDWFTVTGA